MTTKYNRPLIPGDTVRVHKNLHTGAWSVGVRVPGKGWRVAAHVSTVVLLDAVPRCGSTVRIRRDKRRNVIAYIEGTLVNHDAPTCSGTPIRYNPFRADTFTTPDGGEFTGCGEAHFPMGSPYFVAVGGDV